ncbi:Tail Collar domain protein [Paludibacter propionicigenes WB4]|uniref:Tail Collar domain protein n=1 Tax=Paludibacter propionicigenes (strain DSM 17365 / JCM 13257 / WB4) TaxID=694427 RepID=E4T6C1_PALPW|nr:tail fiber protein [Paludibacter propionicigenes]ADQ80265.1 Tail Collar domain protein [Paludibacter propionicigenes WB4]
METFLAFIAAFGFNFPPYYWASCDGTLLPISQNSALYALLGTQYGGNGSSNFGLPDLRGRVMIGAGQGPGLALYEQGESGGTENCTTLVAHNHTGIIGTASATIKAYSASGTSANPVARGSINVLSGSTGGSIYGTTDPDTALNVGGGAVTGSIVTNVTGSGSSFSLMQPYCPINFCIALSGIYPSRG